MFGVGFTFVFVPKVVENLRDRYKVLSHVFCMSIPNPKKRRETRQNDKIPIMKKFLFLFVALVVVTTVQGQITPIQKVGAVETIATARAKNVKLNKLENDYYLCIIATGNRFDDPAIFDLGLSKSEAQQTISDLILLCSNLSKGESLYVMNRDRKIRISNHPMLGVPVLYFDIPGIAGDMTSVTEKELLKFQKALEAYSE